MSGERGEGVSEPFDKVIFNCCGEYMEKGVSVKPAKRR